MKLLYFAWVRQMIGVSEEDYEAPDSAATARQLIEALRGRGPGFAEAFRDLARLRCAINQEHAGFDAAIKAGDEVAFFPPVTGGRR